MEMGPPIKSSVPLLGALNRNRGLMAGSQSWLPDTVFLLGSILCTIWRECFFNVRKAVEKHCSVQILLIPSPTRRPINVASLPTATTTELSRHASEMASASQSYGWELLPPSWHLEGDWWRTADGTICSWARPPLAHGLGVPRPPPGWRAGEYSLPIILRTVGPSAVISLTISLSSSLASSQRLQLKLYLSLVRVFIRVIWNEVLGWARECSSDIPHPGAAVLLFHPREALAVP